MGFAIVQVRNLKALIIAKIQGVVLAPHRPFLQKGVFAIFKVPPGRLPKIEARDLRKGPFLQKGVLQFFRYNTVANYITELPLENN